VGDLILPDRHEVATHDRDIDGLQHRVAEQPEVRDVAFGHVTQTFLERRHPLEPAERCDHAEQQGHLGDLGDVGLAVDRGSFRVDAGGEPVEHQLVHEARQLVGAVVVGREHVPVGDEEEALAGGVFLQREHALDVAGPVPDVQRSRRAVPGQHA
jgi:hypothetical protein